MPDLKTDPNQMAKSDPIQYLLDQYFLREEQSDGEHISSHWRYYSDFFEIQLNGNNEIVRLDGKGFGACRWHSYPHKVINILTLLTHLQHLPRRRQLGELWRRHKDVPVKMDLDPTFDVFRQVCTLDLLKTHIPSVIQKKNLSFLMIGDGYGVLSALLKKEFPDATITLADLGKTLLVQAHGIKKCIPDAKPALIGEDGASSADVVLCPADMADDLSGMHFDVAVNVASMQEMTPETVARYFEILRGSLNSSNLFYCCNRESKTLPGGELLEILNYPWREKDEFLVDEYCPWHKYFLGFRKTARGPRIWGIRVPLVNYYDGDTIHRLAVMDVENK